MERSEPAPPPESDLGIEGGIVEDGLTGAAIPTEAPPPTPTAHGFRVTNALIYVFFNGLQRGSSVLITPLLLARLSVAEYGQYALLVSIYVLAPAILSLGLYGAIQRFYFDTHDPTRRRAITASLVLSHAGAVLGLTLLLDLILRWTVRNVAGIAYGNVELILWASAAAGIYEGVTAYWRAAERPWAVAIANVCSVTSVVSAIALFLLVAGLGLRGVLLGMLVGQALVSAVAFSLVLRETGLAWERMLVVQALAFSVPLIPHILSGWLLRTSDRWLLEHFRSTREVGIYFLAVQLASLVTLVMSSTNEAIAPRLLARYRDQGSEGARAFHRRIFPPYYWTAIGLGCGLILLGPLAGSVISHHKIVGIRPVLTLLAAAMVAAALYVPFGNAFFALKTTPRLLLITLSSAVTNVGLNFLLIPRFGMYGAASSMLISYLLLLTLASTFAHRSLGLQRFPLQLAGGAALLAGVAWLANGRPLP